MPTKTQEAVISNESLVIELESKLDSVTSEAKSILGDAINRIKNIGKYVSKFLKRGTVLTIKPAPELIIGKASILQSLEEVIQREKTRGNTTDVWIDDEIWTWSSLNSRTMPCIEKSLKATIHRFTKTVTHAKICEEIYKLAAEKDWNISEAWNIIIAAILAGEVDTNGTVVVAYFTLKVNTENVFYRFRALRESDGQLNVCVDEVHQDSERHTGDGVVLSN